MKPRVHTVVALCAVALAVTGIGGAVAANAAGGKTVTLRNIAFSPKKLSIKRNTTVTFAFRDDTTSHNVISKGAKRFKNIGVRSSGSQSRKFTAAGTYRYVCTLHPGMSGQITVH
jgi:plastocyanin